MLKSRYYINYTKKWLEKNQYLTSVDWDQVEECYSEQGRKYHNLDHLEEVLKIIWCIIDYLGLHKLPNLEILLVAAIAHDLIYEPGAKDNEEMSANAGLTWFVDKKHKLSSELLFIHIVHNTKKHKSPASIEAAIMLDADLAGLASEPDIYIANSVNIREEYSMYPDPVWDEGRKLFLLEYTNRPTIYFTSYFGPTKDQLAKANMYEELKYVEQRIQAREDGRKTGEPGQNKDGSVQPTLPIGGDDETPQIYIEATR